MKTTMKGLIAVLLLIAGGAVVLAGDAPIADEPLPPEVKKLIGMKIPPKVVEKKGGSVPDFIGFEGMALIVDFESGIDLGYRAGFVGGKWPVLLVSRHFPDRSQVILDVQMLPENLIAWKLVNGKPSYLYGRYRLSPRCRAGDEDIPLVVGLMKQEEGKETCAHYSGRVNRAWQIDRQNGHLTPLSTEDMQCYYISMNDC
ncbi:MAG: hypothetical protein KJ899_13850 [Gammaproteobacteria bacterium]|nr:hypothetical protein [Gammaproteobacteria bacterium]